jgi:TetR/AcrR family transcriptional repressor of nem operon
MMMIMSSAKCTAQPPGNADVKVTREKAAQHRGAIVKAAGRLFRARGFDKVGVAEITEAAGLTHGGFYGHFASKDALAAEACGLVFAESLDKLAARGDDEAALLAYLENYLTESHRERRDSGCPMPALATDIPRQDPVVQKRYAEGVAAFIDGIAKRLPGPIALLSTIVGGMALARATAKAAPEMSAQILASLRAQLTQFTAPPRKRQNG